LEKVEEGGTTATCVYIRGQEKRIWVANVGDSRCVLSRSGVAVPLSRDQRPDRDDEKQRIEEVGGTVVFCPGTGGQRWRVEGTLNISRSLGDKKLKFVSSEPEIHEEIIGDDDQFLILATDGLWNVIDSQQAVDTVKKYYPSRSPAEATEALSRQAMMKQTTDNLCVMVMFLFSPPEFQLPPVLPTPQKKRLLINMGIMSNTTKQDIERENSDKLTIREHSEKSVLVPPRTPRSSTLKNEHYSMKENIIILSPTLRSNISLASPPSNPSNSPPSTSPRSVPKKSPLLSPQNNSSVIVPLKTSPTNFANAPRTSPTHVDYSPLPSPRRKPIDR